ncbi:hypothetical protein BGZ52_003724 [Haplosporangium bisporale]|nr:hypothetical protein BGZ52_003724 [Haplosporangium bisporale]
MDEFHEMVVDIKAAIAAAEENRHCYELRPDGNDYDEDEITNDEDMEQYRRLIPGKRLHSLQTDKVIQDEDLEFIVNNMDTVRKLGVPNVPLGVAAIDALRCHHAMIVELSLQCTKYRHGPTQLEVLALDLVKAMELFKDRGVAVDKQIGICGLPEIRNLIGEHLPRETLLACCRVSKEWCSSFLPYLWQSVDFNAAGPIFSESVTDPRIAHIRQLKFNYSTFEGPMPTQGYLRLEDLEIQQESFHEEQKLVQNGSKGGCAVDRWHLATALLKSLANGTLSSLRVTNPNILPVEFWEAVTHCHQLKSFHMDGAYLPFALAGSPFWKICRSVETLKVTHCEAKDCLLIRTRMLRLKHLTMVRSCIHSERDGWELTKPWLCSPNLESLCYNFSRTSRIDDEFHEMVLDIKAAMAAATAGKNYYEVHSSGVYGEDELDKDMEKYRGLIPGKKLQSLESDKDNIQDEDLGFIVNNMDTLRRLCVPNVHIGVLAVEAFDRHRHTIVELNIQCGPMNTSKVLKTVMSLALLQVLALDLVNVAAFVHSDPWTCLGLKRLYVAFQTLDYSESTEPEMAPENSAVWQRLSCLTKLETLNAYGRGFWTDRFKPVFMLERGLGQLSALTELRQVEVNVYALAATEAHWMMEAWPKLKRVHCRRHRENGEDVDPEVVQALNDRGITVETNALAPLQPFEGPMPTKEYIGLNELDIIQQDP